MKTLLRQSSQFILVGAVQLLLDWSVFVTLSALGLSSTSSNIWGRVSGAIVGFWLNRSYTFAPNEAQVSPRWKQLVRFIVIWLGLTFISSVLIREVHHYFGLHWTWLAKPVVEASLAVLSFFLSRYVIFR